jgi:hypothetical protein
VKTASHTEDRVSSSPFIRHLRYDALVAKWCTVTVEDFTGQRYSIDVRADSSFDAAHLYLVAAKSGTQSGTRLPVPNLSTRFEVSTEGKIHFVEGVALSRWIERRRRELRGPKGFLFSQRPMME